MAVKPVIPPKTATPSTTDIPREQVRDTWPPAVPATPATVADGGPVFQTVAAVPLGLKYSIVKGGADGQFAEVDPDATFVAGDRIRVEVETNDSGYLYVIVSQSSNGSWKVLYPSEETGGMRGGNRVVKGRSYQIPATSFQFDENGGTEKLFVVLSRQPEQDLENMIYSLQETKPKGGRVSKPMMASNLEVEDELVKKMRQTYSRDLLIQKVDDSKPAAGAKSNQPAAPVVPGAPKREKAYYVVNPANTPDARVVADIPLRHQ